MPRELPANITENMFYAMCNLHMSDPVPLQSADLTRPFVYERRWGVFYAPATHPIVMSLLLSWQHGGSRPFDAAELLQLRSDPYVLADHWLKTTPGAAFRSSVGKSIQIGSFKKLTPFERRLFAQASAVFD